APDGPLPVAALRRRAAARGDRARHRQASGRAALRRADRRARHRDRHPRPRGHRPRQPRARDNDGGHHPQRGGRGDGRSRRVARRRPHRLDEGQHGTPDAAGAGVVMVLRALDRKLLRDLWRLKGQAAAIAAVMAAGLAMLVAYIATFASLQLTLQTYYERYRFADVFASLVRAPLALRERIAEIPGVAAVETRIVADVTLDVEGM